MKVKTRSAAFLCIFLSGFVSGASGAPRSAPVNPDFRQSLSERQNSRTSPQLNKDRLSGLIPSPVDFSHTKGQRIGHQGTGLKAPLRYAASYDLRSQGKMTNVRNQGAFGTCWAFASYSSLESILLPSETRDFSENNMANLAGFVLGYNDGGTYLMAAAYLLRWSGPVNESDDPYPNPGGSPQGLSVQKHVQNALFIPDRGNPLDNDNIKQMVAERGAIMTGIYMEDAPAYYSAVNHAYYYNGPAIANHAVAVVGWDDNYDKANFPSAPPGNGAFIAKNSWGAGWGEGGYFYVSYYDARFGTGSTVFDTAGTYANIYQHDPLGMTDAIGFSGATAWFANVFTARGNEQLRAVGFYTGSMNASYEISIYDNCDGASFSGLLGTKTGTIPIAGYHTVDLDAAIPLRTNRAFCVVVKLTTPGYNYPIPIESPVFGYSSPTASRGQSYISDDGVTWSDLTTEAGYAATNVCLKAYASAGANTGLESDLANVLVYPNPVNFATAVHGTVKFKKISENAKIQIFDVTGRSVKTLNPGTDENDGSSGSAEWDGTNDDGEDVAMGMYLYLITDEAGNRRAGKIGVTK